MEPNLYTAIIAALSAVFGACIPVLIQQVGQWRAQRLSQDSTLKLRELDDSVAIRKELREEVRELKKTVDDLEQECEVRNERYWNLLAEHQQLKADYQTVLEQNTAFRKQVADMEKQILRLNSEVLEARKRIAILEDKKSRGLI